MPLLPGQRSAPGHHGESSLDDALRLGRGMRLRLLAAVRALLSDPSIAGLKDAPKLAAVVLYAKSRAPQGRWDDNLSSIWGAELGRWLGMKESTVHHKVLPKLRSSGALRTQEVRNALGQPTGLNCLVMPLWKARKGRDARHPLALSKAELATLLRLCEALFGHGWTPEGREPTPPGLLADRTGKGAATDRLGLLLMVLNTRASGWLQLCGGSVKKREGRGATTLARLLGCSPAGARKVLARLTEAGVVARQRKATATRMHGRGRVMLLPVARAYGRVLAPVEGVSGSRAVVSQRPDGAVGDQAPADAAASLGMPGIYGAADTEGAEDRERPDGAELHADHAPVVTPVVPQQLSCGFSGEAPSGCCGRPECACAREDQAGDGEEPARLTLVDGGPLRGEQPQQSQTDEHDQAQGAGPAEQSSAARVPTAGGQGSSGQQRGRVPRPPSDLEVVLGAVWPLWARLERSGARCRVITVARQEVAAISRVAGPEVAPQLLAARLERRLADQAGPAAVVDPVGWLIKRGLPRRVDCTDFRCDEGLRMDTGGHCETCAYLIADRRGLRAQIAAQVEATMPAETPKERRVVYEQQLREAVAQQQVDALARWEWAAAAQQRRSEAAAVARAKAEAADAARQALPCTDCGAPRAAGLCGTCGEQRALAELIRSTTRTVAAAWADITDPADIAAVRAQAEAGIQADVDRVRAQMQAQGATDQVIAVAARLAVESAAADYESSAVALLARGPEADTEARLAREATMRRAHHFDSRAAAQEAAAQAAEQARQRTARHLLTNRTAALPADQAPAARHDEPDPYAVAAAQVRAAITRPERRPAA
ncbi:hypothetical protein [Streptomyces palmae]|uniref:Uncharacterized protein n=1 Tax=Streptomyces palmae TaxID=1701085 RepID=A0A4Z0GY73_9ACTN|nr:hypothetical protein [Streptomyces palmae]TGB01564.1 hypothetical protein E4099_21020 [Streptomyces palmae]